MLLLPFYLVCERNHHQKIIIRKNNYSKLVEHICNLEEYTSPVPPDTAFDKKTIGILHNLKGGKLTLCHNTYASINQSSIYLVLATSICDLFCSECFLQIFLIKAKEFWALKQIAHCQSINQSINRFASFTMTLF